MSSFSIPSMFSALLKTPKKLKRVAKALSEALLSTPTPSPSKRRRGKRARVEPVLEPGLAEEDTPSLFHPPPDISPKKLFENDNRAKELLRTSAILIQRPNRLLLLWLIGKDGNAERRIKINRR